MEHVDAVVIRGGQSGLAAAGALRELGLNPVVLDASDGPGGSWPHYYDSLTLFSPARFSALPGLPLGGDPDRYPRREEVVDYLTRYAQRLDVDIRTRTRVETVVAADSGFAIRTTDGLSLTTAGIAAATGAFANPLRPDLPGQDGFTGEVLHVADYRSPKPYAGKRIVVVGGGNSAVQVGHELAEVAHVTLASRHPIRFLPQLRDGKDIHHWLTSTGFDHLPLEWLIHFVGGTLVMDTGQYQDALTTGHLERKPMFTALDGDTVVWADGTRETVDVVLLATGYRPSLDYLGPLGALTPDGMPLHSGGISTPQPGLVYLGLEFQRSFASNTLRGVARDAAYVIPPLAAHVRKAPAAAGLWISPEECPASGHPCAPLPLWFDVCQRRRMSNAKVLPLLEPADGQGVAPCCPPLTERPMTADEAERAARMFKALGDPVRLRLFSAVASHEGGEACVCDISDVGVSQPTVSHHLKKLKEAGLLTSERRGTWVYYRVEPSVLAAMGKLLALPAAA